FIEAGPNRILTNLVGRILADVDHVALNVDDKTKSAFLPFADLLASLHALGLPTLDVDPWFAWRDLDDIGVAELRAAATHRSPVEVTVTPTGVVPTADAANPPAPADPPVPTTAPAPPRTPVVGDVVEPVYGSSAVTSSRPSSDFESEVVDVSQQSRQPESWVQETLLQWIQLQTEQTRLLERFLAIQTGEAVQTGPAASGVSRAVSPGAAPVSSPAAPAGWLGQSTAWSAPAAPVPTPPPAPAEPPVAAADVPVPPAGAVASTTNGTNGSHANGSSDVGEGQPVTATIEPALTPSAGNSGDTVPTVEVFAADLLAEVSSRTGYPQDMLELDLPLEAGLGIDSIKVLEIFGGLRQYHEVLADADADDEELLAKFVELETLNDIIGAYQEKRADLVGVDSGGGAAPLA
ncbi:MAG: phosphopantetheine-binding protein, partial [Acidimicrobiales bacterium]